MIADPKVIALFFRIEQNFKRIDIWRDIEYFCDFSVSPLGMLEMLLFTRALTRKVVPRDNHLYKAGKYHLIYFPNQLTMFCNSQAHEKISFQYRKLNWVQLIIFSIIFDPIEWIQVLAGIILPDFQIWNHTTQRFPMYFQSYLFT